jgi:hypothetical protein
MNSLNPFKVLFCFQCTSSRRDSTNIRTALKADLCPNTGFPVFALMTGILGFMAKAPLG